jgi:hypothetical protein
MVFLNEWGWTSKAYGERDALTHGFGRRDHDMLRLGGGRDIKKSFSNPFQS